MDKTAVHKKCSDSEKATLNAHQNSLAGDVTVLKGEADFSFDEQSTLVCDDIKRSPSLRSIDMNVEERFGGSIASLESVCSTDSNISRLSRRSSVMCSRPRRRSLLYMAGKTPPERRTTLVVPMPRIPACQMEDEPDILESKEFDQDLYRMNELKRRNTLCLPHLKSSYPLEVLSTKSCKDVQDTDYEASLRESFTHDGKRKASGDESLVPQKRKPGSSFYIGSSKDSSNRNVKSDSNISTRTMLKEGSEMIWGNESILKDESQCDTTIDPRRESIAFSIDFDEPKKKLKPRGSMRRSQGSAHLFPAGSKESITSSSSNTATVGSRTVQKSKTAVDATRGKENQIPSNTAASLPPVKKSKADKGMLKSRTNNLRKSIRKSISKVRGAKPAV